MFFHTHLPQLHSLRHLAFHNLSEIGDSFLQDVCAAARALPQLISLHLVRLALCMTTLCIGAAQDDTILDIAGDGSSASAMSGPVMPVRCCGHCTGELQHRCRTEGVV